MLLSDRITGGVVAALGVAAVLGASRLPAMPGQQIGPSVFPTVVGIGLVLCGSLIAFGIGRHFEEAGEADLAAHSDEAQLKPPNEPLWLLAGKVLLPPALLLFYALFVNTLGFVPTAFLMVASCAIALGARWWHAALLAAGVAPLLHLVFYKLLRVPLPSGLLPMPW